METKDANKRKMPAPARNTHINEGQLSPDPITNWRGEARFFALLFTPIALALGLVLWGFFHLESSSWRSTQEIEELQRLVEEKRLISGEFRSVVSDLLYVSAQSRIKDYLDAPQNSDLDPLERDLFIFTNEKRVYDQVRVLDETGQEQVKINYMAGRPLRTPRSELGDKGGRYYFGDALKLNQGQIYVSPFDLNVEQGRIEVPHKPTIRFATPLFDRKNRKRGVLVLNYLGAHLIDLLKRVHSLAQGYVMLLNQDGYWLFGANGNQPEWGFMFEGGKDWSLKKIHPEVWRRIEKNASGQFYGALGLITFESVIPSLEAHKAIVRRDDTREMLGQITDYPEHWKLVSVIPNEVLEEARASLRQVFIYIYLVLLGVLAIGVGFVSRVYEIRRTTRLALLRSNESLNTTVRRLTKRNRQVVLVNRMGDLLQSCDSVQETFGIISHYSEELFPKDSGQVCLSDPEGKILNPVAAWGNLDLEHSFAEEDCWALRRGKVHVVEKAGKGPVCPHFPAPLKGPTLCIPMMAHGAVIGLMSLCVDPDLADLPEVEQESSLAARQRLATTVADLIALSISNITLRETLREQSIRDALTGLYNRRYMEDSLTREVSRARRNQTPVSLIMLDVDHFKSFNDNYGHETGDKLLSELGKLLMGHCRKEDIACRYGGEEFLLILPGATREIAVQRAEQIRLAVENRLEIRDASGQTLIATISAGVSCFPQDGESPETAVEAADTAMYQAKNKGRNRVEAAQGSERANQPA